MTSGTIIHPGIIERISGDKVFVRILSQSACSSCHAKGACTIADVEEKIIEAELDPSENRKPGEEVMVKMEESLGHKAVLMGYVLPLIVLGWIHYSYFFHFSNMKAWQHYFPF